MAQSDLSFIPIKPACASVKRKRCDKSQQFRYYQLWYKSGLSVLEFCKKHALKRATFYSWVQRIQAEEAQGCTLPSPDEEKQKPVCQRLDIQLPSGIHCQIDQSLTLTSLVDIVKGLYHAT